MACITLLSDFGLQDASVAIARGILIQQNEHLPIVDISHEIRPFNTAQAAYLLASSWRNFQQGTVHLLLFDLFSGKPDRMIVSAIGGHYFIAADNGVLPRAITSGISSWLYKELPPENNFIDWLKIGAALISQLQDSHPGDLSLQPYVLKADQPAMPPPDTSEIKCQVIHIDRYENVVLDITRQQFETACAGRPFYLRFVQVEEITAISKAYTEVRPGVKLARFNSAGHLEICVNRGNAASLFGLRVGGKNNHIKITFE